MSNIKKGKMECYTTTDGTAFTGEDRKTKAKAYQIDLNNEKLRKKLSKTIWMHLGFKEEDYDIDLWDDNHVALVKKVNEFLEKINYNLSNDFTEFDEIADYIIDVCLNFTDVVNKLIQIITENRESIKIVPT